MLTGGSSRRTSARNTPRYSSRASCSRSRGCSTNRAMRRAPASSISVSSSCGRRPIRVYLKWRKRSGEWDERLLPERPQFDATHARVIGTGVRLELLSTDESSDDHGIEAGVANQVGGDSK